MMMTRNKSSKAANIKLLFMLPAILLLVFNFSCSTTNDKPASLDEVIVVAEGTPSLPASTDIDENASNTEIPVEEIFFIVEEMPKFEGDDKGDKFRMYIAKNLTYPEEAAKKGISGRVYVQFVVKSDGTVGNVKVVRGVDPLLDAEAIRVIESSPKWEPGKQRGKVVNLAYTFPINFALQ